MRLGIRGEKITEKCLRKKGFSILRRRFYTRFGEIDLIAEKSGILYFIEVKTRSRSDYGDPLEAITPRKLQRLTNAAKIFLLTAWPGKILPRVEFIAAAVHERGRRSWVDIVKIFPG